MLLRRFLCLGVVLAFLAGPVHAQPAQTPYPDVAPQGVTADYSGDETRPIPYPVMYEPGFRAALNEGTRTPSGAPGVGYWVNSADYDYDVRVHPEDKRLTGSGTVTYVNNSPDTLGYALAHLRQNIHEEGAIRNRNAEVTGGMTIDRITMGGDELQIIRSRQDYQRYGKGYSLTDTRMVLYPSQPILPGDTLSFEVDWHFAIPGPGNFRMGHDESAYYMAYWYPQMAVYDDVNGWQAEMYQGDGEFYMDWGTYEIDITVPAGWLVGATGTLQNGDAILSDTVRDRLAQAAEQDSTVRVVTAEERGSATQAPADGDSTITWQYRAENVRDFAFGTSGEYVWDATHADVEGASEPPMIHTFYRPGTNAWDRSAEYSRFSVEHLSEMIMPYPYPHMTAVEGVISSGMEYPMMTLIGGDRTPESLFRVTYHEISHMWFPMIVGTDEKSYAWMDEGTTTYNTAEGQSDFYEMNAWSRENQQFYYRYAGTELDGPSMRHADNYTVNTPTRGLASYPKPGLMLRALEGILGTETFLEGYRTYAERWAYKHPTPYDMFNTFEDVAGRDLDWFWTSAFYEDWAYDHGITEVETTEDAVEVTVRDYGRMVMPIVLQATYADGETITRRVGVDAWMNGANQVTVSLQPGDVTSVVIDPDGYFPDVDRSDNAWSKDDASQP